MTPDEEPLLIDGYLSEYHMTQFHARIVATPSSEGPWPAGASPLVNPVGHTPAADVEASCTGLVALVGNEVEHVIHRPVDDDLASTTTAHLERSRRSQRLHPHFTVSAPYMPWT